VGKRSLESAIKQSGRDVKVTWKPFLLRKGIPEEGKPKGGDPSTRVPARLKQVGQQAGIDFSGKTDRYPNTIKAHTLLQYAEEQEPIKQNGLQEILFRHYFTDGLYPDDTNLRLAAEEAQLDVQRAMAAVADPAQRQQAEAAALKNSRSGINGVPFFFVNGQPLGSGAQPPETFVEVFQQC